MRKLVVIFFLIIAHAANAQMQSAEEKNLEAFLPASFGEYEVDGSAVTTTSRAEGRSYVLSSKNYKNDKRTLSVMVMDCKNSPALFEKYTQAWTVPEVDDEFQLIRRTAVGEMPAWQSYDKKKKSGQLSINANNRFLIVISGDNVTSEFLIAAAKQLKFATLPK